MIVSVLPRSIISIAFLVVLSGCGGGSGSPTAPSSTLTQSFALTPGTYALPDSNGYQCSMVIPPNNAPGGSITVTMPSPGTQAITYVPVAAGASPPASYTIANAAEIFAVTNVAVVFQGEPSASCALIGSANSGISYVDPNDPGSLYGPTIVVTTGASGSTIVSVPADVSFPIGAL